MKTFMDFLETETGNTKTESFIDNFLGTLIEEKVLDKTILKEDRMTTLVNGIVVGLLIKIKQQTEKLKQQNDTNKKLDELGELIKISSYGGLISGFIGDKNTRILNKIRKVR